VIVLGLFYYRAPGREPELGLELGGQNLHPCLFFKTKFDLKRPCRVPNCAGRGARGRLIVCFITAAGPAESPGLSSASSSAARSRVSPCDMVRQGLHPCPMKHKNPGEINASFVAKPDQRPRRAHKPKSSTIILFQSSLFGVPDTL